MDQYKGDLVGQLKQLKKEFESLREEKRNLFNQPGKPSNNLRDINENIDRCKEDIRKVRYLIDASENNYTAPKILSLN